ncbi:MAG: 23S rRNA (adenine(2503)-C(2))-methyltransferase RlmN [Myxococcales bacterium]|nr:23S rRNA (adenine(2503)-C(2))-methyltransferase RlmN [Myxococcales bacterium]
MAALGERPYRAGQIFRAIHGRGVLEPGQMTDLSAPLRARLIEAGFTAPARVGDVHRAADGTRKLVLELGGGARVECVLIPMTGSAEPDADLGALADDDDDEVEPETETEEPRKRITLCVSTQFGCAMGCVFCASGQAGLLRGLGAAEIVAQVLIARQYLEPREYLRNLVFMGMGEPLHHYEETARAIRLITHPEGLNMGPRRITVSTVGLAAGIRRLGEDFDGKVGLAISLHAPDDATRDRIIPINRRYPLSELLDALRRYPLPRRRRITIEYTLIEGVNDSPEQARALLRTLRGLRVKVNLIAMNRIAASKLGAPAPARVEQFRSVLTDGGLSCFVRARRGDDVSAACGQLALSGDLARARRG